MKVIQNRWKQALIGALLTAVGALLYLLPAKIPDRHASMPLLLHALSLVCILGGLGHIAHALSMQNLGNWYGLAVFITICGVAAYLWLHKSLEHCSRLALNVGIPSPKFVCVTAFGIGAVWLAYLAVLFAKGFAQGMRTPPLAKRSSAPTDERSQ